MVVIDNVVILPGDIPVTLISYTPSVVLPNPISPTPPVVNLSLFGVGASVVGTSHVFVQPSTLTFETVRTMSSVSVTEDKLIAPAQAIIEITRHASVVFASGTELSVSFNGAPITEIYFNNIPATRMYRGETLVWGPQ